MNYGADDGALDEPATTNGTTKPEPSLTISEAATACGVERREIERRHRQGDFPNAWRADPEPGRSAVQPLWRIPVADLRQAGLGMAAGPSPLIVDVAETERLHAELEAWQQRALLAEAIAAERLQALEDARNALRMLNVVLESRNDVPPSAESDSEHDTLDDESGEAPPQRLRGNWLR